MKKLVILESPTKTKTVQNYLGQNYRVMSSNGHISNLRYTGPYRMGVNLETFEGDYWIDKQKLPIVKQLQKAAKTASKVILATDPDREGEAIAYHLLNELKLEKKYQRVVFHEITKEVVLDAFKHPRDINYDLVKAQEARRILDRLLGFRLSKLLRTKIKSQSAGRVQSVALKLLCKKELEIKKFKPEEFWIVEGEYQKYIMQLTHFQGKTITLKTKADVLAVKKGLAKDNYTVSKIVSQTKHTKPNKPLVTSTMLQQANNLFGFSSKQTSFLAQKLYEGIMIKDEQIGLITYPRTDSARLSEGFIKKAQAYLTKQYGPEYVSAAFATKKANNAKKEEQNILIQNAHEAIRMTDINKTPDSIKPYLTSQQYRLYQLIYQSTLASLMSDIKYLFQKIIITNNDYSFVIKGKLLKFKGFLEVFTLLKNTYVSLPKLKEESKITPNKLQGIQKFTKPPARIGEARLIKILEEEGVGRPSTYAAIFAILNKRGYVTVENKQIFVTKKGVITNKLLQKWFKEVINEKYTANLEKELDKIAQGEANKYDLLSKFWVNLEPKILLAFEKIKVSTAEKVGEKCPKCHHPLVYRYGSYGEFIGCSFFPKCYYTKAVTSIEEKPCPLCKKGVLVLKRGGRFKKPFLGCSAYKSIKCRYIEQYKPPVKKEAHNQHKVIDFLAE